MELNAADRERAALLCRELDLTDPGAVMGYGAACQKQVASCAGTALAHLRAGDTGSAGALLAELAAELRDFSPGPPKGGLFRKKGRKDLARRCAAARERADQAKAVLEDQRNLLTRDAVLLGKLCDALRENCRDLAVQTEAGRQYLERAGSIPEEMRDRFRRRLYDLEVSHTVGLQTIAQLSLLQRSDLALSEKITAMLNATLPLWEGRLLLLLGEARAAEAAQAPEAGRAAAQMSAALEELLRLRQDDLESRRSAERILEEQGT